MNNTTIESSLRVIVSKESLTTRFSDYSNVYLLPLICLFGIVTSFVCLYVSLSKRDESNAKTLDYILINSIIDFVFLVIESFLFLIRCGALCPYGYTYAAKFYEIFIYQYVGYIFVTAQVLLNIYVAVDRLSMFSVTKITKNRKPVSIYRIFAICTLISALANALPYPIAKDIVVTGIFRPEGFNSTYSEILYVRGTRKGFDSPFMSNLLIVVLAIKNPVLFVVLCLASIWVSLRFRAYLNARKLLIKRAIATEGSTLRPTSHSMMMTNSNDAKKPSSAEKKENNLTFLTIVYCVKTLVGNSIDSFALILNIFQVDVYVKYGFINITGNSLFFASHGVSFFIYYFFYNVFRRKFLEIFCFKKRV